MLEIIRLNPASSCTDYVMVELQGEVDCHSDKTTTARTIGTMCQAHQTADTLQLTIGHHQLTGKLVDLKKPLIVLQKVSDPHINYQVGTWQTFPPVVFIKEAGDAGTQKSAPFANCSQRKSKPLSGFEDRKKTLSCHFTHSLALSAGSWHHSQEIPFQDATKGHDIKAT